MATCQISPCKRPASTLDVFLLAAQHYKKKKKKSEYTMSEF